MGDREETGSGESGKRRIGETAHGPLTPFALWHMARSLRSRYERVDNLSSEREEGMIKTKAQERYIDSAS